MCHVMNYSRGKLTIALLFAVLAMQISGEPPTINGADLVINGESFMEASNTRDELSQLAREAGVLEANDKFKQIAKSGSSIGQIFGFYKDCTPKPTYLISDGGGIDLMNGTCTDENCGTIQSCKNTLLEYLAEMKKGGTKKLLWMIYPDPVPGGFVGQNLKDNQDIWARVIPDVMKDIDTPEVYLVDLRETWKGHYSEYTSDGIHQTDAGSKATAKAFWEAMKADDWAFFDTTTGITSTTRTPFSIATTPPSAIFSQVTGNGNVAVSFSIDQPSPVTLHLTTISGRSIFSASRRVTTSGLQTVNFPLGAVASGIYCCNVRAGQSFMRTTLLVP